MAKTFDGTSDAIQIPLSSQQQMSGAQSHSCWVNFNSVSSRQDFFNDWANFTDAGSGVDGLAWLLSLISSGGNFLYYLSSNGTAALPIDSGIAPTTGVWYHVCGTFNGTTGSIYVNGVLRNSAATGFTNLSSNARQGIRIGRGTFEPSSIKYYTNGKIGDAAIYNVALIAPEVRQIWNGRSPLEIRSSNLIGYWDLSTTPIPHGVAVDRGVYRKINGALTGTRPFSDPPALRKEKPRMLHVLGAFQAPAAGAFQPAWAVNSNVMIQSGVRAA